MNQLAKITMTNPRDGKKWTLNILKTNPNVIRMKDLSDSLGNRGRYLYSVPKAIERINLKNGRDITINVQENRDLLKYVDIEKLIYFYDMYEDKIEKQEKKTYFASIKSFMKELKMMFGKAPVEPVKERNATPQPKIGEQKTLSPMRSSIDIMMAELVKIDEMMMNRDDELEDKFKDVSEKLEKATKQLELAEAKYEELKNINLELVKQKDAMSTEVNALRRFKNGVLGLANEK
jgi:predicted RND superfamily exporter protein